MPPVHALPAGQGLQVPFPSKAYCVAVHAVAADAVHENPAGQELHAMEPAGAKVPVEQGTAASGVGHIEPAGHVVQVAAPAAEKEPDGHT